MAPFLLSHMTQFYLSEFTIEGEHDHDRPQLSPFPTADHASSFPFPILFNNSQDHPSQQQQLKPIEFMLLGGPSTDSALNSNFDNDPTLNSNTNISEQSLVDHCTKEGNSQISDKWMSSKMRIMRKMMINSDQTVAEAASNLETKNQDQRRQHNPDNSSRSNNSGGIIRVCSDCNTTKTPLWRSGPRGPKSLCNACGIRQRKARRAIAAAAGILVATEKPTKKRSKEKRVDVDRTVPFKKRCRMITAATSGTAKKKFRFDDFSIRLSKNSALHRVFPQDERDAAILLMALSCGYIRS